VKEADYDESFDLHAAGTQAWLKEIAQQAVHSARWSKPLRLQLALLSARWSELLRQQGAHRLPEEAGDVLAGRVEQGVVKPGEEVVFLPTHTASNPCTGKVFTVEMHHSRVDFANPGDNVGLNIKGLDKINMPRSGDVMVYKKDTTLGQTKEFSAQIQVLDIPNEIKVGYSPIGFVRCGRSACRISKLVWKMGKETGGKKADEPHALKSNEMAECSFTPQQPLVCDTFKNCEGLSRVAFMDGNGVVMLGKVISCERKEEAAAGGKKK